MNFLKKAIACAQMRFQVFATLAYGGYGFLYFTYREVVHENGFGAGTNYGANATKRGAIFFVYFGF